MNIKGIAQSRLTPEMPLDSLSRYLIEIQRRDLTPKEAFKAAYISGVLRTLPDLPPEIMKELMETENTTEAIVAAYKLGCIKGST